MLRTNGERLRESVEAMARIGATPGGGVSRPALSDEDREARALFAAMAGEAGLSLRVDDLGNQYARMEGTEPDADPVLLGSHLDSVPLGGRFDGVLGVLTPLEVLRTLRERGVVPRRPVEIVNFTNEEGVRFEPAMMSSGVLAGRFDPEYVYARTDREGRTFLQELERIGYRGDRANRPRRIHAFIEVHIEQGPVLEAEGLPLAVVSGILGVQWFDVTLTGQAQHAGPSPMRLRRDAMVTAARIIAAVRDLALEYPDPVVATVGRLQPIPGVINQIPGRVVISIDVRHWADEGLRELAARAEALVRRIAAEERVEVEVDPFWRIAPTVFDPRLVERLEAHAREMGMPLRRVVSGAGHDAKYISEIAPAVMLFVRTIGGKSHCETEAILWEDAAKAADLLLQMVLDLAGS